jgi:hypothetical protein
MTEFEKGIIREYRSIMAHMERTIASVHGVLTKAETDRRDRLEAQLINCGLSRVMTAEDVQNYHYNRLERVMAKAFLSFEAPGSREK